VARNLGIKSNIALPLMRDDAVIGTLVLDANEPGGFSDSQVALLQTFAEQAVIAIGSAETYRALRERTAALAARNSEYGERIEHQAAIINVLQAMSASPGDPRPAFDQITRLALELCGGAGSGLYELEDGFVHVRSLHGLDSATNAVWARNFPMAPTRSVTAVRAIMDQRIVHYRDIGAESEIHPATVKLGVRSAMALPLMRNDKAVGSIALNSREPGGFSDSQVALLKTFAEQAVIAINSAEAYRALQTRTGDLQESLEYQTATSEVLKVISRSTFDLQPVFQTVADTAVRLCHADQAGIYLDENGEYRWASGSSQLPEYERIEREARIRPGTGTLVGRVALEGRPVQILDAWTDTGYEAKEDARVGAIHTLLGIPLLRDGSPIGVIGLGRQKIEPFTERQIELVNTFAAQAVIAIENARLITEQREALEQQIATAEVLQVINASPGNLGPVFDTVLESALRLCAASFGALLAYDGEHIERVALLGVPPRVRRMEPPKSTHQTGCPDIAGH
jgi:GAF domain-containing protein